MGSLSVQPRPLPSPALSIPLSRQRALLRATLLVADAGALALSFYLAYIARFHLKLTLAPEVPPDPEFYRFLGYALTPLFAAVFAINRLYDLRTLLGGVSEYSRVFASVTFGHVALVLLAFFDTTAQVSRTWIVVSWLGSAFFVILVRFLIRRSVYRLRRRRFFLSPTLIVGTNEEAKALAEDLSDPRSSGLDVLGFVGSERTLDETAVLGRMSDLRNLIARYEVEEVVVAAAAVDRDELFAVCEAVNWQPRTRLKISSGIHELLTTGMTVQNRGPVPLVGINKVRLDPTSLLLKTVFEFTLSLLTVLALAPLLAAVGLAIRLSSPGPVVHRRKVLGLSGQPFDAFKFRTMYVDGDEILAKCPVIKTLLERDHKVKDDPRITPVGRWLRRFSLDELPQLFNVLRGEMGLVGPRMISPAEVQKYGKHKMNLLTVRPGITGLWQVSGRSDLAYDERVRLDMAYIRNYSIWTDLQILFVQTLPAVVSGRGAY